MKYNLEWSFKWLIVGFIVFWLIELLAFFNNFTAHPHPIMEFSLPFVFWGIASYFDYIFKRGRQDD